MKRILTLALLLLAISPAHACDYGASYSIVQPPVSVIAAPAYYAAPVSYGYLAAPLPVVSYGYSGQVVAAPVVYNAPVFSSVGVYGASLSYGASFGVVRSRSVFVGRGFSRGFGVRIR